MTELGSALAQVFGELVHGPRARGSATVLNSGDVGLLASLDRLSAQDASRSTNDGATIAAHAQHLRFGLSLMNDWARVGGDPFANAKWDEAWKVGSVNDEQWAEIRAGLREEAEQWLQALAAAPAHMVKDASGLIGSIAHLGYHLGAIRQIHKDTRGPREGTYS